MIELPMKSEIERISMELLTQAGALDVYPTPVANILKLTDLRIEKSLNLSRVDPNYSLKGGVDLKRALSGVRGFLDRNDKTIYIDKEMLPARQNFVQLHEIGHEVLIWQNELLQFLDNDSTLSEDTIEEFEMEANYFASITLFQHDRFDAELSKQGLALKTGMSIAKKFGASSHSALRRMVDRSEKRCALLVLEKPSGKIFNCCFKSFSQSNPFTEAFGNVTLPSEFDRSWSFYHDYSFNRKFREDGLVNIQTENGLVKFRYHFFDNSFNAFVFLIPRADLPLRQSKRIKAAA
jgi:hypothetical protein